MPTLISYGNELIRINSEKNRIEYSTNRGSSWSSRCTSTSYGTFMELNEMDGKLFATTSKGLYYSTNKGSSWSKK